MDTAFWQSVFQENHVVKIGISLSKEAWEEMQPAQNAGGSGGGGGGTRFEYVKANLTVDGDDSGKNTVSNRSLIAIKPFIKRRIASANAQLAGKSKGVKIEGCGGRPPGGRPGSRPPRSLKKPEAPTGNTQLSTKHTPPFQL